jgi:hypothetical protein
MKWRLVRRDRLFLVEALMPEARDPEGAADLLDADADPERIEHMLDDDRLFQRLMDDEEVLVRVTPWLFFTVLLRRARRDLECEAFTIEQRDRQKVVLFDADQVTDLLARDTVLDYLAWMLASFTRVESVTVRYPVRPGVWFRYRTSELDVEGMMRMAQRAEEPFRFEPYKRIADVCLFLAGMFPEHIDAQYRYPASRQVRPGARGRTIKRLEDYESHGRAFYRLAAEHEMARMEGLDDVLMTLSEHFLLAEKPLVFLSGRYLRFTRHKVFGVQ